MRSEAVAAVLVVWVFARLATRRPVLHHWFFVFAVAGASAVFGDVSASLDGPARLVARVLGAFAGFAAVTLFVDGLRRESGVRGLPPPLLAGAFAGCAAAAVLLGALPPERARIVLGVVVATILLSAVDPLLRASRRRAGSIAIAIGIVVYALGRTVLVIAHVRGLDVNAVGRVADTASILTFGVALLVYGLQGLRESRRARGAVGHRRTVA
ncbi:MAG: hypothetical protein JO225_04030 [Candidatus Eremiobacteraeota bacterium]|nr:hypothetical protein [Candidatus Eremiobacteraeota bacterium]